ncbi:ATP-grasp fold amidoligase family protein [Amphibacillus sediminis]|uniref:ATP-grasp fold amidoligase family protein n=1 Tax=Amphibacillus sediminis TaxID=360185 RepID=UPI00082A4265|nr:ATP-grasp fold amidoligase family protein [Amphibacillus sediminis]
MLNDKTDQSQNEEDLINTLYKKQQELVSAKKLTSRFKKKYDVETKTASWGIVRFFHPIVVMINYLKNIIKAPTLIKENEKLKLQLQQNELDNEKLIQSLIDKITVSVDFLNDAEINLLVRLLRDKGEAIHFLTDLIEEKKLTQAKLSFILKKVAQAFNENPNEELRQAVLNKLLFLLRPPIISDFFVRELNKSVIDYQELDSFQYYLFLEQRKHHLNQDSPYVQLDDKRKAYHLIEVLGFECPNFSETIYNLANIPIEKNTVIKPEHGAGSRGVYIIGSEAIYAVKQNEQLKDIQSLKQEMQKDLEQKRVIDDRWYIEELVAEQDTPARDLKFYSFYGEVALILEVERFPENRYCWWDGDGKRVITGKYDNDLFIGKGVTNAQIEIAKAISLELPVPFMRIDFLAADKRFVFGEFTPKPGNYEEFDYQTDQRLGKYFVEAEQRLYHDFSQGKVFKNYNGIKS